MAVNIVQLAALEVKKTADVIDVKVTQYDRNFLHYVCWRLAVNNAPCKAATVICRPNQ